MALATVDLIGSFNSEFHEFFITNNRIHGSVGGRFVILAAINVAGFANRTVRNKHMQWAIEAACYAAIVLCVIGLFGSKSKGVWAAIAIALAVHLLLSIRGALGRRSMATGAALLVALELFVLLFHQAIWTTVAPSLDGLAESSLQGPWQRRPGGNDPRSNCLRRRPAARHLSAADDVVQRRRSVVAQRPVRRRNRLEGPLQPRILRRVRRRPHNGYLEIAMRYGVLGLGFFATLYVWTVAMARRRCG